MRMYIEHVYGANLELDPASFCANEKERRGSPWITTKAMPGNLGPALAKAICDRGCHKEGN